ncbi:MAG: hypothetical protein M3Y57_07125 [Acidobacteriota bacterium]|nr:hypothetical protein [Acidobacteriota bacterium]
MKSIWNIALLAWVLIGGEPLFGDTIAATYSFTGSAQNEVIANGFLTADGVASGSVSGWRGVVFDTHNDINLTTLQNYGTFTMVFPGGDTAFGNLHEDDVNVSLITFSGPFTQALMFTGGTGQFAKVSGTLNGGGFIYPTSYTTSGAGTLSAPDLVASPEPGSGVLLLVGLAVCGLSSILLVTRKQISRQQPLHLLNHFSPLLRILLLVGERD